MALMNPYLQFDGTAAEALEFYRSVFGGELQTSNYGEFGQGGPDEAAKIMHGHLTTPAGFTLMGADVPEGMPSPGNGLVSLSGDDSDGLAEIWTGLVEGGSVVVPLEAAPWGDRFGQLVDRFGVSWMVNIAGG